MRSWGNGRRCARWLRAMGDGDCESRSGGSGWSSGGLSRAQHCGVATHCRYLAAVTEPAAVGLCRPCCSGGTALMPPLSGAGRRVRACPSPMLTLSADDAGSASCASGQRRGRRTGLRAAARWARPSGWVGMAVLALPRWQKRVATGLAPCCSVPGIRDPGAGQRGDAFGVGVGSVWRPRETL